MTPEAEVVGLIARFFPSFQALPPEEQNERTEQLGQFLAQGWSVGAAGLAQRGLEIPAEVVTKLDAWAGRVKDAKRGGVTFLAYVRTGLRDDARFQKVMTALAGLYTRSRPAAASGPVTRSLSAGAPAAPAAPPPGAPAAGGRTGTFAVTASGRLPAVPPPPPAAAITASGRLPAVPPPPPSPSGRFPPQTPPPPPPPGRPTPNPAAGRTGTMSVPVVPPAPGRATGTFATPAVPPPPPPKPTIVPPAKVTAARPAAPPPEEPSEETPAAAEKVEIEEFSLDAGDTPEQPVAAPAVKRPAAPSGEIEEFSLDADATGEEAPAADAAPAKPKMDPSKSAFSDELDGLSFGGGTKAPRKRRKRTPDESDSGESEVSEGGFFDASMLADLDPSSGSSSKASAPSPAPSSELSDENPPLDFGDEPAAAPPPPPPSPEPELAPESSEAPAAAPGDFLASLVGTGIKADPDLAAPPPPPARPAPAPPRPAGPSPAAPVAKPGAPAPAPGTAAGWSAFEDALASGGQLFKDDDEPKTAAPPPKPAEKPKDTGPKSYGDLDLMPEEEKKPEEEAPEVDEKILAEPIKPKEVKEVKKAKVSGRSKIPVSEFTPETTDGEANDPSEVRAQGEADPEEVAPDDAGQAAIFRFERSGDPTALAEARKIFQEAIAKAPHATARAFAEAGMSKVMLLAGNAQLAQQGAETALARDPGNPFAIEIVAKVARGEAERAKLATGLAQARTLISSGRSADARRFLEQRLASEYPDAPQPWLLAALLGKLEGDDERFEQAIAQAWARMPAKKHGDVPLGGTLDVDLAYVVCVHGRQKFKSFDPEFLRQTVEDVDSKDNLVAGLFRVGIACARIGLARAKLGRGSQRKAWTAIASGLIGLQYYDQAVEAVDKATQLKPDENESKALDVERRFAGQMRRAFDKPGVKAQLGRYKCLGAQALSLASIERMQQAAKEKQAREAELTKSAIETATLVGRDAHMREAVIEAAQALGKPDPTGDVDLAEAELAAVKDERARLGQSAAPAPEKKGFLSKLAGAAAAAADKVASTAKDAQLKLREGQLEKKRDEAVKRLGLAIARELRDHEFKNEALKAFIKKSVTLDAFIDFHAEEERVAKVELDTLGRSS